MTLTSPPQRLALCRLDPMDPIPDWVPDGPLLSVTRTDDELSILCPDGPHIPAAIRTERGWRALVVQGPLPFEAVGILAALSGCLAAAQVSVFVLSTYDTDYVLVKEDQLERAISALRAAGHDVS